MENEANERTGAGDNGAEQPQPGGQQVLALVVAKAADDGQGMTVQLQIGQGVTNRVDFCLMLAQMAVNVAQRAREEEQRQQIAVPQIQIPGNIDLRGGGAVPGGPPLQFRPPGRRGKGRG